MISSEILTSGTLDGFVEIVFAALLMAIGVVAGWVWIKNDRRSDQQDRRTDAIENMVQQLRIDQVGAANEVTKLALHVSENFSGKAETQSSLARIHEKIESLNTDVGGKIEKLNDDVTKKIDGLRSDVREDIRMALATHRT